jgi:hypothetical protein
MQGVSSVWKQNQQPYQHTRLAGSELFSSCIKGICFQQCFAHDVCLWQLHAVFPTCRIIFRAVRWRIRWPSVSRQLQKTSSQSSMREGAKKKNNVPLDGRVRRLFVVTPETKIQRDQCRGQKTGKKQTGYLGHSAIFHTYLYSLSFGCLLHAFLAPKIR